MLPRYTIFQLPLIQGGLNAPVLPDMIDACLMSIWIKLLTENNLWARAERSIIEKTLMTKRAITVKNALNRNPVKMKGWPEHWKPYVAAWKCANGKVKDEVGNWH